MPSEKSLAENGLKWSGRLKVINKITVRRTCDRNWSRWCWVFWSSFLSSHTFKKKEKKIDHLTYFRGSSWSLSMLSASLSLSCRHAWSTKGASASESEELAYSVLRKRPELRFYFPSFFYTENSQDIATDDHHGDHIIQLQKSAINNSKKCLFLVICY